MKGKQAAVSAATAASAKAAAAAEEQEEEQTNSDSKARAFSTALELYVYVGVCVCEWVCVQLDFWQFVERQNVSKCNQNTRTHRTHTHMQNWVCMRTWESVVFGMRTLSMY